MGWSDEHVNEHVRLLMEAGYITAIRFEGNDRIIFGAIRLLWSGHEFLDNARDDTTWHKARSTIAGKVGSVSMTILNQVLAALVSAQLKAAGLL